MWNGVERRRFSRVQYPCLITVFKKMARAFPILTHTENISVGGIRVIIGKKIEVATEVDLEIDLKDTLPNVLSRGMITWVKRVLLARGDKSSPRRKDAGMVKGKVAWMRAIASTRKGDPTRYDIGIQFINLKKIDQERIAHIINNFVKER